MMFPRGEQHQKWYSLIRMMRASLVLDILLRPITFNMYVHVDTPSVIQ